MARKSLFPFLMAAALAGGYHAGVYPIHPVKQPEPSIPAILPEDSAPGNPATNLLQ